MISFTAAFCTGEIRRRNGRLTTGRFHPLGSVAANPLRMGVIASAVLGRLLQHSHLLNIRGESYRYKRQASLFPSLQQTSLEARESSHGADRSIGKYRVFPHADAGPDLVSGARC